MTTREQVVAEARSWLGTPFHHQGRLKGVGVDCAGLIYCVQHELGLICHEHFIQRDDVAPYLGYGHVPVAGKLQKACAQFLEVIKIGEALPGDVLLFRFEAQPTHLAFVGDYHEGRLSIIHAYSLSRKVIEARLDDAWCARIVSAYRLYGVE